MIHRTLQAGLIIGFVAVAPAFAQMQSAANPCVTTADMQIYSNVFMHRVTGDLLGYELAIKHKSDTEVDVLLYLFEGGDGGDGIPLSGQISNNRLNVTGTWVERLTEYPSKKEIVQERAVEIHGAIGSSAFQGTLTISKFPQQIRLKHVKRIWSCKNSKN